MNIATRHWNSLDAEQRRRLLERSEDDIDSLISETRDLMEKVRVEGDEALAETARAFDRAQVHADFLAVTTDEIEAAYDKLSKDMHETLSHVIENCRRYHRPQKPSGMHMNEIRTGVLAGERVTPIDSVGLYVPRGRGSFPSMLYMLAVPAVIAGVPRIAIATPALEDGTVDPACLVAADLCGVSEIYRVGGPAVIAAFAYGTETIASVRKIVGPGSARVTAAKRIVSGMVDTGPPAGPTESMIIADSTADPWKLSLDLCTEAEHGLDSQALLVTPSEPIAEAVAEIVPEITASLPEPRREFVESVLGNYGGILLCDSIDQACEIANRFASEHLQIQTVDPWATASAIRDAGEILIGDNTPFSMANYATGANAVLPTGGWAHTHGSVSVADYVKRSSIVHVTQAGYAELSEHTARMGEYEGFAAHAAAVRMRDRSM
ncbi:MAG: histidinol dehydrogenase [Spirochaetota bacterium]